MKRTENDYLIHLLYCAVHDITPEDIPSHISMEKVLQKGIEHEVANIAYLAIVQIEDRVPGEIMTAWNEYYFNAIKRDGAQNKARKEILAALHSEGIYTLEVQGTVVKMYYPQSHLRMMSDIDFIIPAEKLTAAEKIMQSLGYETENPKGNEIDAKKDSLFVELHTEFFDEDKEVHSALKEPFSYAQYDENGNAIVSDTVFYLYHLLHTIKHSMKRGAGIRRIIDLYYLENALRDKVDYSYIDGILKQYGLYETKEELLRVKDYWFCGVKPESDISSCEDDILSAGNHGSDIVSYRNKFRKAREGGNRFVKISYIRSVIFPPKEDIYESYPICRNHRLPLVLCWIYRWASPVFSKEKRESVKKFFLRVK